MLKCLWNVPVLLLTGGTLLAQTPPAPAFEVATIKPAAPLDRAKVLSGQTHIGLKTDAGRVDIGYLSLADLIRLAYRIKPYQLANPDSLPSQRWDIVAKIPDGASADQVPEMIQALLADRFKLSVRHTDMEHPIYALIAARSRPKLKEAEPDAAPAGDGQAGIVLGTGPNQVRVTPSTGGRGAAIFSPKFGQLKMAAGEAGGIRLQFSRVQMADLADLLSQFTDRPVLDRTDLEGAYQVTLELSRDDLMNVVRAAGGGLDMMAGPGFGGAPARSPVDAASTPTSSIFTAVQQLGLKLDARKAPVEMIVVDHVEKTPTEN